MANERVLVTFEGRDKGLISTAKDAAEAVRRIQFDVERLRKRAPTLDIFRNSLRGAQQTLRSLQAQRAFYDQILTSGRQLNAQEQARYDLLGREISAQLKIVQNLQRIVRLRDEENIKWEQQFQIAKQIQNLEARSAAARDPQVTRARIAAEFDRIRQDEIVQASVDSLLGRQGVLTAITKFISGGQSASATFAALQNAATGFSLAAAAASTATALFSLQLKTLHVVGQGLTKAFQGVILGLSSYVRLVSNIVTIQTRAVASIGSFIGRLWEKWRAFRQTRQEMEQSNGAIRAYGNNLRGLVGTVNNLNRGINILGASIRQIGQALQNAGVLLTVYFSLPSTTLLRGIIDTSLGLNDVLIEIRKNTDLTMREVQGYIRDGIEALASFTPTDIVDIATIISDAAKSGVPEDFLIPFAQVIDQLAVATDIRPEDATTAIARIMNIFYDLDELAAQGGEEFIKVVNGIGSAIAKLGQENALYESEIVSATLRLAPAARALRMEVHEALALASTVVQMSASPERAGTQASALLVSLGVDIEKFANAVGLSRQELEELINQDPVGTLNRFAHTIANLTSNTERLTAANELAGRVGGKAFGSLSSGSNKLAQNLSLAEEAFVKGIALQEEFYKATDSVANQIKILRNNFKVLAVTLGDSVLPLFTEAISLIIPFVQALTQYLRDFSRVSEQASKSLRLWIVGIIALVAIIGPVFYAIGSLLFQIGIFTTGFTGLVALIGRALSGPLAVVGALLSLLTPFRALIAVIGLATAAMIYFGNTSQTVASGVVNIFRGMGDAVIGILNNVIVGINNFFINLYNGVIALIRGLVGSMQNFAIFTKQALEGKNSPGKAVVDSISGAKDDAEKAGEELGEAIGDGVSKGIKQSTQGTLQDVFNLAAGFGDGFRDVLYTMGPQALDVFDDLFSTVGSVFSGFASYFDLDQDTISSEMQKVASIMLDAFNGMGDGLEYVSGLFEGIRPYIGGFADDLQKLYDQTVKYNKEQERLIRLREKLDGFDRKTRQMINEIASRSDLSVTERAGMIRNLKQDRAQEKIELQDQIKEQEKVVEASRDEMDAQKQLIRVLERLIPKRESVKPDDRETKKIGELSDLNMSLAGSYDDIADAISGTSLAMGSFVGNLQKTRDLIIGFFSGLLNENLFVEGYEPVWESFFEGWDAGRATRENITEWFDERAEQLSGFIGLIKAVGKAFALFGAGVQSGFTGEDALPGGLTRSELSMKEFAAFGAGLAIGNVGSFLDDMFGIIIKRLFGDEEPGKVIGNKLQESLNTFLGKIMLDSDIINSIERIAQAIKTIVTNLSLAAGYSFDNMPVLAGSIATIIDNVVGGVASFTEFVAALTQIIAFMTGADKDIVNLFTALGKLDGTDSLASSILTADLLGGSQGGAKLISGAGKIGEALGELISEMLTNLFNQINTQGISSIATAIIDFLLGVISGIEPSLVGDIFSTIPNAIIDALSNVNQDQLNKAATGIVDAFLSIGDAIKFDQAVDIVFKIANALAVALANANWQSLTNPLRDIAMSLTQGLATFDWTSLSTGFANIAQAVMNVLDNPTIWYNAGVAFANFVMFVVDTLESLEWANMTSAIFDNFVTAVLTAFEEIRWWDLLWSLDHIFREAARGFFEFMLSNFLSMIGLGGLNRTALGRGRSGTEDPMAPTAMGIAPPDIRLTQMWTGAMSEADKAHLEAYVSALRAEIIIALLETINPANWFKGWFGGKEDDLPEKAKSSGPFKNLLSGASEFLGGMFGFGSSQDLAKQASDIFEGAANIATPQVTSSATTLGGSAGVGFTTGFKSEVETKNQWSSSVYNGLAAWINSNEASLEALGDNVYTIVAGSISASFVAKTTYLDSIRSGLASWIAVNISKLEGYGRVAATHILSGMSKAFRTTTTMSDMLETFESFFKNEGARIYEWFFKFGGSLWDGLLDGFRGATREDAAGYFRKEILPGILSSASAASVETIDYVMEDYGVVAQSHTQDPAYMPSMTPIGETSQQSVTLNVNLYGHTVKDMEELADKVFKLIERRLRNPR